MRWLLVLLILPLPGIARGDSLVATRVIRAMDVLAASDMTLVAAAIPGALSDPSAALGLEARVTIYPGRPLRAADIGPPALVDRNSLVTLSYTTGGLTINAEGRALTRAAAGDAVRVMNLASRTTVTGRLQPDGVVAVGP